MESSNTNLDNLSDDEKEQLEKINTDNKGLLDRYPNEALDKIMSL